MRAFLLAVAAVLIISGLIIAGVVTWRVWVDNRTASVDVALVTTGGGTGTTGASIETGGMSLQTPAAQAGTNGRDPIVVIVPRVNIMVVTPGPEVPMAAVPPLQETGPVEESCMRTTVPGFALDTPVYARGTVRLYNEPDVDAPTQGEFNAGAVFGILATGEDGGTAIESCGLRWYRVRVSGASAIAVEGWVLGDAVDDVAPQPPITVTPGCTPQPGPCPGGCDCQQDCYQQPCCTPQPQPCQPDCWNPCVDPNCQSNPYPCNWDYPRG